MRSRLSNHSDGQNSALSILCFRARVVKDDLIHGRGSSRVWKRQASAAMSGTAIVIRSVHGWRWQGQALRRFRKRRVTRQSRCRPGIGTCHQPTGSPLWNGSPPVLNNRFFERRHSPDIRMICRGAEAGVKALRPRSGARERGLDSGPASAMLWTSGEYHFSPHIVHWDSL
jgi:hypothetical protein